MLLFSWATAAARPGVRMALVVTDSASLDVNAAVLGGLVTPTPSKALASLNCPGLGLDDDSTLVASAASDCSALGRRLGQARTCPLSVIKRKHSYLRSNDVPPSLGPESITGMQVLRAWRHDPEQARNGRSQLTFPGTDQRR